MPSPNITKPLIGLQNWIANQVKEDPILEKQMNKGALANLTKKGNNAMGSELFKTFMHKYLKKQGPPGPPPRRGLVWKPQTHRWIRPKGRDLTSPMDERESEMRFGVLEQRIGDSMEDIITDAMKDIQDDFGGRHGELSNEAMVSKLKEKLAFHYTTGADTNVFPHEEIADYLGEEPGDIADYFDEFDITNYHTPSDTGADYDPHDSDDYPRIDYSQKFVERERPELQRIMNERLASADTRLGIYEIGQRMDTSSKILNEVMLDEKGTFGGKSIFDELGINTDNLSDEDEQHFNDLMDSITESAMKHHGVTNVSPGDYYDEDEDDDEIDTDPEGLSTHGHQNFLRREAERKKAGIVRPYDSPDYRL